MKKGTKSRNAGGRLHPVEGLELPKIEHPFESFETVHEALSNKSKARKRKGDDAKSGLEDGKH